MSGPTPAQVASVERRFPGAVDDGRKAAAVMAELGLSMTRYAQVLNAMLADPEFIALAPVQARILRARRDRFRRSRAA